MKDQLIKKYRQAKDDKNYIIAGQLKAELKDKYKMSDKDVDKILTAEGLDLFKSIFNL